VSVLGELDHDQIEEVLRGEVVGRIGCHAEGRTYIVPITYAYDGRAVYGRSTEGMKLRMMRTSPDVCFEVERVDELARWQCVVAWGRFEELEGNEADQALQVLVARLEQATTSGPRLPAHRYPPAPLPGEGQAFPAAVYRIVLGHRTGRYES